MYRGSGYIYAMFIQVIHPAPKPSLIVSGKLKIQLLLPDCVSRRLYVYVHPEILIPVSVGMTNNSENVILGNRIFNIEDDFGFETTPPFMARDRDILLEHIYGCA